MAERAPGADAAAAPKGIARLLTPRVVLPALLVVLVATVLFTPATDRTGDFKLSTYSTEPQGARGLFEIARRLGWRPERREVGLTPGLARAANRIARTDSAASSLPPTADERLDTTASYAVLAPPNDLTAAEAGALLDAVRRGAGLLVVLREGATLGDSLHIQPSSDGAPQAGLARAGECADSTSSAETGLINWPGGRIHSYWLVPRAPLPAGTVTFASVELTRSQIRARRRAAEKRATESKRAQARRDSAGRHEDSVAHAGVPVGDSTRRDSTRRDSTRRDSTRGDSARLAAAPRAADSAAADDDDEDSAATAVEDSVALSRPLVDTADAPARVDSIAHEPAAIGFPLGAGRVVVVADPDWLRNDVLRVCRWNAGVNAVRMLEYLDRGQAGGRRLVFDEFHQGFGRHPSTLRAMYRALTASAPGRALAQALVAALLLLAAAGARALPPRSSARLERRSPLEHVGALSRAYAQVGATRLATRRLVRGVRRRHGGGADVTVRFGRAAAGSEGDETFLGAVAERFPATAADVALVGEALRTPRSPAQFLEVGRALERIEAAITGRAVPAPTSPATAPAASPSAAAPRPTATR